MLITLNSDDDAAQAAQLLRTPDESRDRVLKRFVELASQALAIPGSFISVLDQERQTIPVAHAFPLTNSSRDLSFCRYVVDDDAPMVIPDTFDDPRFAQHPLAVGTPGIRFYAGIPLKNRHNHILGTLCVTDTHPHAFSSTQLATLTLLAELVTAFLDAWHAASFLDVITGLPNRQRLMRDLQSLEDEAAGRVHQLVVMECMDIARIYDLARAWGMLPMERLLKHMATLLPQRLSHATRIKLYTVATGRFAILAPPEAPVSITAIAAALQGINADLGDGIAVALTPRVGETRYTAGELSPQEGLRRAISALHEATDRDLLAVHFDAATDRRRTSDLMLMNDLAEALRHNHGLYLVYQPKVCLHSGETIGLEALLRWRHPLRGELPPGIFVPLAEQTNLMSALTDWVLQQTVVQLCAWRDDGQMLPVSINVSECDFSREGFASRVDLLMHSAGLPRALLGIECMETQSILESPAALDGLKKLSQKGFCLSLDDFGTGYSNISYLRHMPLDVIKLDKSLISELASDEASRIIAHSIINMLKALNYQVLAEGVEDAVTQTLLQSYGCDQAQGFYYSPALPAGALRKWLHTGLPNGDARIADAPPPAAVRPIRRTRPVR
ncbi:bifunctional diguanylate cyclase/phosphodiesterase [Pantoea sp. 1.19]|uniref:putative bifunctional diguanylate cyclase/phosphodiesterase n=1 Tax=Pantoea sp. 1.19 TaxID=1925589 RepID=UPI000948BC07|nr:GGDEF and EAL domain-containing protein [Pantoea sp. 1.19]